ncbi:MAG TPA: isoprenylcysteine carboxylmethyltransferase family protein [Pyrinomonadaceae bacterium]|nr:isoprenylcysteine carboxylmethyltransferase family protein [Pyrinomonadaceae bacterium]
MEQISYYVSIFAFVVVIACWFVFAFTFLLRKKPESGKETVRASRSILGIVLQGVGFGSVWAIRRTPMFSPVVESQYVLNIVLETLGIIVAVASVWLATSAIRELGRQWSFAARLVEGHDLVTGGVYNIVRHPIYTAMFGMLISTAIIMTRWYVAVPAAAIFLIGTLIRTRSEEKLLKDAFGGEYDAYAAKVPAILPFARF